ncbi:MAG: glycosyltransferase family 2 protein [Phycisphaerae bacterium]|nr:glycosyltransferase family 2 protein [Phycisphaerae bacterium]
MSDPAGIIAGPRASATRPGTRIGRFPDIHQLHSAARSGTIANTRERRNRQEGRDWLGARLISIVVPVYNEQDSLETLVGEIREVTQALGLNIEIVFVDDGSRDASWATIQRLAQDDLRLGGIRFRRNAGKAAALMAGFASARGELVLTMDADLQDPPQEIPRLLAKLDEGLDVVSGWKQRRLDPWHKVYPSRVFNRVIGLLTGVRLHDHVCGLKLYRREVLNNLRIHGELHRFLGVLAAAHGYKVAEIPTLHRARTRGVGKYGFSRFAKGFLDLITVLVLTRYRWRPQHLIGVAGLWTIILSPLLALAVWILNTRYLSPAVLDAVRLAMAGILAGVFLAAIGLTAELVVAQRPPVGLYEVAERTGWCVTSAAASTLDPKTPPGHHGC